MADRAAKGRKAGPGPLHERRSSARRAGPLQAFWFVFRLVSLMSRPLVLKRRDGRLRLGFAERRSATPLPQAAAPAADAKPALATVLRQRALEFAPHDAVQAMHHVLLVQDTLERRGWAGVEALPAPVLGQALQQTRLLYRHRPDEALAEVIARLRPLLLAAEGRVQREARRPDATASGQMEVSEASNSDFEASARSWFGDLAEPSATRDAAAATPDRVEPKRQSQA